MTYDEAGEKEISRRHFLKGIPSCAFLWAPCSAFHPLAVCKMEEETAARDLQPV